MGKKEKIKLKQEKINYLWKEMDKENELQKDRFFHDGNRTNQTRIMNEINKTQHEINALSRSPLDKYKKYFPDKVSVQSPGLAGFAPVFKAEWKIPKDDYQNRVNFLPNKFNIYIRFQNSQ
eukprot:TRINITY_DN110932_c0_g1_i1.p1 TRINITY_DN110932_c0_g1~~TRINITY_DN110932_c0_g1_i1.p1  ORF type:complete len:121 (-),score=7.95 TRINITY_DN110932_c0_g1_i1:30-392(-)